MSQVALALKSLRYSSDAHRHAPPVSGVDLSPAAIPSFSLADNSWLAETRTATA